MRMQELKPASMRTDEEREFLKMATIYSDGRYSLEAIATEFLKTFGHLPEDCAKLHTWTGEQMTWRARWKPGMIEKPV